MNEAAQRLLLVERDPWLWPVASCIEDRHTNYLRTQAWINQEFGSLYSFASAHLYYGLHYRKKEKNWIFREWLPHAKDVFLVGDFNGWDLTAHPLKKVNLPKAPWQGDWEIIVPDLGHNSCYKIYVHDCDGNWKLRMPSYTFYTEQDPNNHDFRAKVWNPPSPIPSPKRLKSPHTPLIYEAHIGMAQEKEGVGSYTEFTEKILPRIKDLGYNTLQLMGIAEHPYYGSFGYHVSNFFAPSSRFGTPDDLKVLVRTAHHLGICVLMDVVHAHFVPNINEGLYALDGSPDLYNYPEPHGTHPYWGSKMFAYNKNEVRRFLLSNLRYWMEEFGFDGFRFDGVTAMLYFHRGYVDFFGSYKNYFGEEVDADALIYLRLANDLIHELGGWSLAEEVSGMPGTTSPCHEGGMGFNARLSMGIPDFWIKLLKEKQDEDWVMQEIWDTLSDRLPQVPQIAYCESHDQALVGDQTLAFRLMGSEIYSHMHIQAQSGVIDRGMALHKMIRLLTLALGSGGGGYLNFMGNEFGHPEWIDFPRQGNHWSYQHARRQWSLADQTNLRYHFLQNFDRAMIQWAQEVQPIQMGMARLLKIDEENKTLVFDLCHGTYLLAFNFHAQHSIPHYTIPLYQSGRYKLLFDSDQTDFGGFGRVENEGIYFTQPCQNSSSEAYLSYLSVYLINRAVQVWKFIG